MFNFLATFSFIVNSHSSAGKYSIAISAGLASIVIGEVILGRKPGFMFTLTAIIVGSILYRIIVAVVLQLGLSTDDLKLLTALLVGIALTVPVMVSKRKQIATYKKLTKEKENA